MKWHISDPHFYHDNVIKYEKRPFKNVHEMNDTIINNINAKVMVDDTLIWHGDVCFGNRKQWRKILKRIKCKNHILILGNHDKNVPHDCFLLITTRMHIQIAGQTVILSHYPFRWPWWKRMWKGSIRFVERRIYDDGKAFLIHGHTHGNGVVAPHEAGPTDRAIHVGVDQWNFFPVSHKQIEKIINSRASKMKRQSRKKDQEAVLKAINALNGGMFM